MFQSPRSMGKMDAIKFDEFSSGLSAEDQKNLLAVIDTVYRIFTFDRCNTMTEEDKLERFQGFMDEICNYMDIDSCEAVDHTYDALSEETSALGAENDIEKIEEK